jgi:hypothetical protein
MFVLNVVKNLAGRKETLGLFALNVGMDIVTNVVKENVLVVVEKQREHKERCID